MKILLKLFAILFLLTSITYATTFDVLVLPADLYNKKENYYGFEEVSEIVANDIIKNFNSSNGKIVSPTLYDVRIKQNKNPKLKIADILRDYKETNKLDYAKLKEVANIFSCKSILLVSSQVITDKNSAKRGFWEVLDISSAFEITHTYKLETSVVLLDTVNNLVMWSNNYSLTLNNLSAKNFSKAAEELEKIKLYSKTIVAPSASQNIMLRFYPKAILPIENEIKQESGEALRFERNIPEKPKAKPAEPYTGEMIFQI